MHILIAVLGALAAAFWAFTYFMRAAQEGREMAGEVKGMVRRGKWSRRVDKNLVENLSDPREAAAVLMVQLAQYDGAITEKQKNQIVEDMRAAFHADEETGEGLFAFARMAVGEINDAGNSVRKILRPVLETCTAAEREDCIRLLERAAEIEGPPNDMQRRLIAEARRFLLEG